MYLKPCPSSPIRFSKGSSRLSNIGDRPDGQAVPDRLAKIDEEDRHAFRFLGDGADRRRPREQDHQIRMLYARDPDLLPIDDVAIAFPHRGRLDLGRVAAGCRFGDAHRLKAQLAARDLRQVGASLRLRSMPDERIHVIHLTVAGAGVGAGSVDFLHDHRGLGEAEAGAAIGFRNQGGHPAGLGERLDKFRGIAALRVDATMILRGKLCAKRTDGLADLSVGVFGGRPHDRFLSMFPACAADRLRSAALAAGHGQNPFAGAAIEFACTELQTQAPLMKRPRL